MASGSRILDIAEQIDRFNAAIGRAGSPAVAVLQSAVLLRYGSARCCPRMERRSCGLARLAGTLKDAKAAIVVDGC